MNSERFLSNLSPPKSPLVTPNVTGNLKKFPRKMQLVTLSRLKRGTRVRNKCSIHVALHVALKTCKIPRVYRDCSAVALKLPYIPPTSQSFKSSSDLFSAGRWLLAVKVWIPALRTLRPFVAIESSFIRVIRSHPWLRNPGSGGSQQSTLNKCVHWPAPAGFLPPM